MALDLNDPEDQAAVEKLIGEAKAGLETKNSQLLDELKPLKRRLADLDGLDADEYKRLKADAEKSEEDRLKSAGEFDKLRESLTTKHGEELGARDEAIKSLRSALENEKIGASLVRELGAAGITEEGLDLLPERLSKFVRLVEEGGKYSTSVVDADGDARLGEGGKPISLKELVAEAKEKYPSAFSASSGSGGGYRPGGGGGEGKLTPEQAGKLTPREYAEAREKRLI